MTVRLQVDGLSKRFGGLQAVSGVSFDVWRGEIFGVIGPNGAGKTTLFNLVAGLLRPSAGTVRLEGVEITGWRSDRVARAGIGRTFQNVRVFQGETVAENLRRSALLAQWSDPLACLGLRRRSPDRTSACQEVLAFVGLAQGWGTRAGALSYGQQKVLGIGIALMQSPKVLLMDEPAAGLNPSEKQAVGELIRRIRDERGIDVVLVEHDMRLVMGVCDRILVVNQGRSVATDSPMAIKANPAVIEAYLGSDYEFA